MPGAPESCYLGALTMSILAWEATWGSGRHNLLPPCCEAGHWVAGGQEMFAGCLSASNRDKVRPAGEVFVNSYSQT